VIRAWESLAVVLLSLSQESAPGELGPTPKTRERAAFIVVGVLPLQHPVQALGLHDAAGVRAVLGRILSEHRSSVACALPPPDDEELPEPLCLHPSMSAANGVLVVTVPKKLASSDPVQYRAVGVSSGVGAAGDVLVCEIRTYVATCGTCLGKVLMQLCRTPEG
jgi:hypothetical protein